MKSARESIKKPNQSAAETRPKFIGFTDEERAAMKERVQEMKQVTGAGEGEDGEGAVLAKIAEMAEPDRSMGRRLHEIIKANAPALVPRLWHGMPAYSKDGKGRMLFSASPEVQNEVRDNRLLRQGESR